MDDEQRVEQLTERVRERRRAFDAAEPGQPEYQRALTEVLLATKELVDFEDGIPGRRDTAARAVTASVVRRCGIAALVAALAVAAVSAPVATQRWWLILLLPLAGLGGWMALRRGPGGAADDLVRRRHAAGAVLAVALVCAGVVLSMAFVNWVVGGLALAGVGLAVWCGIELHRRQPGGGGGVVPATDG